MHTRTLVRFGAARLEKSTAFKKSRSGNRRSGVRARVYRARSMCGAYPFPGDLRAKFAWKEANRLSRGELIDNTAVTCSSLDRRPAALPLFLLSSLSQSLPSSTPPCPLTPRNSLYLSRSARNITQFELTIPDLP